MKRTSKSMTGTQPPVILYREDLIELAELLNQQDGELNIGTNSYEYESLEELLQNTNDDLEGLKLTRRSPRISIDFDSSLGVWIHATEDDLISKGIVAGVKDLLHKRRRKAHVALKRVLGIGAWVGGIGGGALIGSGRLSIALPLMLLLPLDLLYSLMKKPSILSRRSRAETGGFWIRNADQITIAIIGAVVGVALTVLVTAMLAAKK